MRKIIFRGFSKYLCEWVYGDLEHVKQDHVRIWPLHASKDNRADDVSPESVGQYTGLKDSKGHEIYEGDIVKNVNGFREEFGQVAQVKFNDRHCAFMLFYPDGDCIPMDAERQYEIVGNSYENPNS